MLPRLLASPATRTRAVLAGLPLAALATATTSSAQSTELVFSVDYHGPIIGQPGGLGPITHGDLLVRNGQSVIGPALPPDILVPGAVLGLQQYSFCQVTAGPGQPCPIEINALSFGKDRLLRPGALDAYTIYFSVDEYAVGDDSLAGAQGPNLRSESQVGDSSADVWTSGPLPPGPVPIPPPGPGRVNAVVFDGDGQFSGSGAIGPGLGLTEPNVPGAGLPGALNDTGDHIDALATEPAYAPAKDGIYFSIDGGGIDPVFNYQHSGSAGTEAVAPGDILVLPPGGGGMFQVYAPANLLGLGPLDDIDALILHENGIPGYQPWSVLFDWVPASGALPAPGAPGALAAFGPPPSDLLLYSVKRGSPIIGTPDGSGILIEEGDLLLPPPTLGGLPLIYVPGEAMGLKTERSSPPGERGDDLTGASIAEAGETFVDCNSNGVEDSVDIAIGTSTDTNLNGVPDECEPPGSGWCYCPSPVDPCSNPYASGGCENVTGVGGILTGTGSSSLFMDDLVLTASQLPINNFALTFVGQGATSVTLGNGVRCVDADLGAGTSLYRRPVCPTGPGGTCVETGIGNWSCTDPLLPPAACIMVGSTWSFQTWYRDNMGADQGACGAGSNVTNAWEVTFTP